MDNLNPTLSSSVATPAESSGGGGVWSLPFAVFGLIIFFAAGFGAGLVVMNLRSEKAILVAQPQSEFGLEEMESITIPGDRAFASLGESTFISYPIVRDNQIIFVPINPEIPSFKPNIESSWGVSTLGFGSSDPLLSLDGQKIALVTKDSGDVIVMTADGKDQVTIGSGFGFVQFAAWSPNSQKLIFYSQSPSIRELFFPDGPVPESAIPKVQALKAGDFASGFYLADLAKGELKHLPFFEGLGFRSWVGNNKILATFADVNPDKYVVYDFGQAQADVQILDNVFTPYFGVQLSSNDSGEFWALTLAPEKSMNSS